MVASVILSTYNSVDWLEKVLIGFSVQTVLDFELIIADDGSSKETQQLIELYRAKCPFVIKHIWQKDEGFQKSRILNKAIVASETDYLIFTDGDCIPRKDFVAVHLAKRKASCFLSGGYFKLNKKISALIEHSDIVGQNCFSWRWLKRKGLPFSLKILKLVVVGFFADFMNRITPTKATWNGHNSSGWKTDIISVNGFNENMQYGGLDRELGERLFNKGIKSIQIRYSAVCLHLEHARKYVTEESIKKNLIIRKQTIKNKITFTPNGIFKKR
jgi:glycosyltransferase involved in cell wall biosynthesis